MGRPAFCPTVYVVDDDAEMLRQIMSLLKSVELPAEPYPGALAFLEHCPPSLSGCLVLDMRMPGMGGLQLMETLAARDIRFPTIMISAYGDVPSVIRAMRLGALDFFQKPFSEQVLLDRIHEALRLSLRLRDQESAAADLLDRAAQLTTREKDVFKAILAGRGTKEIATQLGISPKTVDIHRVHLTSKTKAGSIAQLIVMGLQIRNRL